MDTQATDGQNVFAMLIGRNQNKDMFSSCYDQRDSRVFGMYDTYWQNIQLAPPNTQLLFVNCMSAPGKHFVIMNPGTVKSFMGQNNSIPLLNTTQSIRSVKTEVLLTQRFPVKAASNMHAFMMRHTTIHLLNLQVAKVLCGGNMCDALMMYEMASQQTSVHVTCLLKERQKFVWFWT